MFSTSSRNTSDHYDVNLLFFDKFSHDQKIFIHIFFNNLEDSKKMIDISLIYECI